MRRPLIKACIPPCRVKSIPVAGPRLFLGPFSSSAPTATRQPLIHISNATFYQNYPTSSKFEKENPPIFLNLSFNLPSTVPGSNRIEEPLQHWAILGSSGKAKFLKVLNGQYICIPPTARSYPYLASDEIERKNHRLRFPGFAIKYVGFNENAQSASGGVRGAYLSARYESRREITDFTVLQYLTGQTELNPFEDGDHTNHQVLERVARDLNLTSLLDMPVSNLSNGQTRRARIAKALMDEPEVLLLDEPFMGLDPPTVKNLSSLLHNLAAKSGPRLIMTFRPQDPVPEWITHLVILGDGNTVALQGERPAVLRHMQIWKAVSERNNEFYETLSPAERSVYDDAEKLRETGSFESNMNLLNDFNLVSNPDSSPTAKKPATYGEPIIEMEGVRVSYGEKVVLGDWKQTIDGQTNHGLHWTVRRGQRWGVFGLNGSGKTTLVSLITSDHPQAYAQPIRLFGRSRLPEPGKPGISVFDLQRRIGHSSPEIHGFFPRNLTIRAAIESAWADTFLAKPKLDSSRRMDVDSALRFFEAELNPDFVSSSSQLSEPANMDWSASLRFSDLTVAQQRLLLFLRAIIHKPDLVVLDEPFAGMSPSLRNKCLHFLEVGELRIPSSRSNGIDGHDMWHLPPENPNSGVRHTGLSEDQSLIVISHVKEEVPDIVSHWMVLPSVQQKEDGRDLEFRTGILGDNEKIASEEVWRQIWDI